MTPVTLPSSDKQQEAGPRTGLLATHGLAAIDDALLAARTKLAVAETRLAESHDEAQSIIQDAVEQARLISSRADRDAEEQRTEAQQHAAELTAVAEQAAAKIRREADLMLADAENGLARSVNRPTNESDQPTSPTRRDMRSE